MKLFEEQVDLLKKIEKTERMLISKDKTIKTSTKYQFIYETIAQNNFKQMTTYFCELLEGSRSGYYSYINASASRAEREKADVKVKDVILKAFNRRGYKKGSRSIKIGRASCRE